MRQEITRLQVQALTVGRKKASGQNFVENAKVRGQGKISPGQDFDCGRSSPYSACLGDTHIVVRCKLKYYAS